jgi:predicted signal transduction protein with EAL and GGDEF domain
MPGIRSVPDFPLRPPRHSPLRHSADYPLAQRRIGTGRHGSEMVRAIGARAHTLGMDVVAEGVETPAQAEQLIALGCECAQGFHYSKAVDADAAGQLIAAQPWEQGEERERSEVVGYA